MKTLSEKEYCALVVRVLQAEGWTIYQEVAIPGGCVDIVAVRGVIRWAIEVKVSMNLAVMEQGRRNVPYFHYSSIAVPAPAKGSFGHSWRFAAEVGKVFGFGVLSIHEEKQRRPEHLRKQATGALNRRPAAVKLWDQQQTECAAGGNRGGQWTDFKWTVRQLEHAARFKPGVKLREAVRGIEHHYSNEPSAVGCVSRYIRSGIITTLRLDNGCLFLVSS